MLHAGLFEMQLALLPRDLQENSLFYILIKSSLEYSCIVWDPHQQEDIDKLALDWVFRDQQSFSSQ